MNDDLDLNRVESITEESFQVLLDIIYKIGSDVRIVEFGSGSSSVRLAMELQSARILSIESSQGYLLRTRALAQAYNVQDLLEIRHAPLQFQTYGPGHILSYQENEFTGLDDIDCVIIDGPPFYTLRGREACLYQVYARLKVGGIVILDDVQRKAEKQILNNWLQVYPDCFRVEIIKTGHWLAILQKLMSVEPRWDNQAKCADSLVVDSNYERIKLALLQITDRGFINWLAGRCRPGRECLQLLQQIRDAYGIASNNLAAQVEADSKLIHGKPWREEIKHIELCLRLFGMGVAPFSQREVVEKSAK